MNKILLEKRFGHPVLVESEPIRLAQISVTDDTLLGSVFVHPRYAEGSQFELFEFRGYRRGRSVDVLLEKPITHEVQTYGIANFKGVGRCYYRDEFLIHPHHYARDEFSRIWGAVKATDGEAEFTSDLFRKNSIPHTPYAAINKIPESVRKNISALGFGDVPELCQIVRLQRTNIRITDDIIIRDFADPISIAQIDSAIINAQLAYAQRGEMIYLDGLLDSNRFVDGMLTDLENYSVKELDSECAAQFLEALLTTSQRILDPESYSRYFKLLRERTGFEEKRGIFTGSYSDELRQRLQRDEKLLRERIREAYGKRLYNEQIITPFS